MAVIQHPPASFHSGFFFLLLFFYLPFVCWGSVIIYRRGEGGEGGRKAEGSSEDFCATITFTLRLCNFLLTPLPPTPPPPCHWHLIGSQFLISPPLYYVNDHPPPPENNVISLQTPPLPTPTGDKRGLTGTSRGTRYILGGREWLHNKNESNPFSLFVRVPNVRIKLFQVTKC